MEEISLNKLLKEKKILETDVGKFSYAKNLGEGGNSFVFQFERGDINFAIKFLKPSTESKLNRFKDEFFCLSQIPTHKNIVATYHFDKVTISNIDYFIIIMKHYSGTLSSQGHVADLDEGKKTEKAWELFCCLANSLSHLHLNHIIHRDVKPQNIFFDECIEEYVLGDLGIAHFSDLVFHRESKTKPSERLANFGFSAPEQIDSIGELTPACDIYSLGQVIYWYLTNKTIRGLKMARLSNPDSPEKLKWLDLILEKCLANEPSSRFQSISEISDFIKELKESPKHDYWPTLHKFDKAIRRSFPKINGSLEVSDAKSIERFISNFQSDCNVDEFWYMTLEGGDNTCGEIKKLDPEKWLFCDEVEIELSKLLVYLDNSYPYKNFFILLVKPSEPFSTIDENGKAVARNLPSHCDSDYATLWNDRYIDSNDTRNGYYEHNGEVIAVDRVNFSDRRRHLKKYAYIMVPKGTATAVMMDRTPTERFLERVVESDSIEANSLSDYMNETRGYHSSEITKYN